MSGREEIDPERRAAIGMVVQILRAVGVRWKTLERAFDRERTQLWRYAGDDPVPPEQDATPSGFTEGIPMTQGADATPEVQP